MSCMIAILYFLTINGLELLGGSTVFRPVFRGLLADYAYVFATLFWVGFSHIPGNLEDTDISRVPISRAFYPTQDRGWLLHFWELDVKWVFAALPFGFLIMLLFYYDHVCFPFLPLVPNKQRDTDQMQNVSSLGAQARHFPLKKPAGFHWDFFLLGCTTFISGIIGIPMPNGLVPQAPVHTDSLTIYETDLRLIPTIDSDGEGEGVEIRRPITKATAVVEQRISHFVMGLGIIGTMTGPLLIVLLTMPSAVFAGVFLTVGWGSVGTSGIVNKAVFLLLEDRFVQRDHPLLRVQRRKILLWIVCQAIGVAACVAISQTIAAIGFPVLIIALIPFRVWVIPKWYSQDELDVLDNLTANNSAVLESLGGPPKFPGEEQVREEHINLERAYNEQRDGVPRQRAGSIHR